MRRVLAVRATAAPEVEQASAPVEAELSEEKRSIQSMLAKPYK